MIQFRGGPRFDFLTRFFSLLDVSGSLFVSQGPLIAGNYWVEEGPARLTDTPSSPGSISGACWPSYDDAGDLTKHFHELMTFMAKLSRLSATSMNEITAEDALAVRIEAFKLSMELEAWWQSRPPSLRDQETNWRRNPRTPSLTEGETLVEEGFSSTKSCYYGCILYLNHIINPVGLAADNDEVLFARKLVLDIAKETPEGYGLEMGIYYGLFTAGASLYQDLEAEDMVRKKLKADTRICLYVSVLPRRHIQTD